MGVDFVLEENKEKLQEFLVYYELHVADKTFYVHGLIHAEDSPDAMDRMPETMRGDGWTLQKKGTYGAVKDENREHIHKMLHRIGGGIILP